MKFSVLLQMCCSPIILTVEGSLASVDKLQLECEWLPGARDGMAAQALFKSKCSLVAKATGVLFDDSNEFSLLNILHTATDWLDIYSIEMLHVA